MGGHPLGAPEEVDAEVEIQGKEKHVVYIGAHNRP